MQEIKNEITHFFLSTNYPNPFNPTTTINFTLPVEGIVTLKVFDIQGRELRTLLNEGRNVGTHSLTFQGDDLSNGVYFLRFMVNAQSGENLYSKVSKLVLMK